MRRTKPEITKDKFFDRNERKKLMRTCVEKAELDLIHGRKTWVYRYMLVDLALYSGLRVGEIASLKIKNLYLKVQDPYLFVTSTKTKKKRNVYIDSGLVKHLKQFLKLKKNTFLESIEEEAPVFASPRGKHVPINTLQKSFKRAIEESKLDDCYSIHSARHTYATFLLHDTNNLKYVQNQLGHQNMSMTALYSGILPEENGKLANKIIRD